MSDVSLQCWVDGKDHFLRPADKGSPRAALDAVGCLCCRSLLLACAQFGVHKDPKGLFCKAAFEPVSPQPAPVPGALPPEKNSLCNSMLSGQKLPILKITEMMTWE